MSRSDLHAPAVGGEDVFSYSFDREQWRGSYPTRQAALAAARNAIASWPDVAAGIWIGRRVEVPLPVNNLAEPILGVLRSRLEASGDRRIDLESVPTDAVQSLDHAVAATLIDWMQRQERLRVGPARRRPGTAVEAVSEHPLPLVHHVPEVDHNEVHILGNEG